MCVKYEGWKDMVLPWNDTYLETGLTMQLKHDDITYVIF